MEIPTMKSVPSTEVKNTFTKLPIQYQHIVKKNSNVSRGTTAKGDGVVFLDTDSIEDMLGDWKKMKFPVDIEFLGRGISGAFNEKHWAWLLIGDSFYCTIEYGDAGIVIQLFSKKRGIKTACAAIMGDSSTVFYDDGYRTRMNFGEILDAVHGMRKSWKGRHYDITEKNCRDFVRALGEKMDPSFNPPNAVLDSLVRLTTLIPIDCIFPNQRSV